MSTLWREIFLISCVCCLPVAIVRHWNSSWQWNFEQFQAFLADNPPTEEQKTVLAQISRQTGLSPIEEPWQYLHELQNTFDYSKIKYTEDFYDLDLNQMHLSSPRSGRSSMTEISGAIPAAEKPEKRWPSVRNLTGRAAIGSFLPSTCVAKGWS